MYNEYWWEFYFGMYRIICILNLKIEMTEVRCGLQILK